MLDQRLQLLAAKIKALIDASDYSPADVARHIGVDRSAVSRWMGGTRTPTVQNLIDLAALLGVEARDMWEGPEAVPATIEQKAMLDEMADLNPTQQQLLLALARSLRGTP